MSKRVKGLYNIKYNLFIEIIYWNYLLKLFIEIIKSILILEIIKINNYFYNFFVYIFIIFFIFF